MRDGDITHSEQQPWCIDDVAFESIATARIHDDEQLFFLLASASFVEITSDLYTDNLVRYFDGDSEVQQWLKQHWEPEEIQHGVALRRYVATVWPEFDWAGAYQAFLTEYSSYCTVEALGPTPALEMAARCVVETGTSAFYTTLQHLSPEPVLAHLAGLIRNDEVRHYKHFYRYFLSYCDSQATSRYAVLKTLWSRIAEIDEEDARCAFRHTFEVRHSDRQCRESDYLAFRRNFNICAKRHFPFDMAVRMCVKPLRLNRSVQRAALPLLATGARHLLWR